MPERKKIKTKAEIEKEFISSFMEQITAAKARAKFAKKEETKAERKKLKPSIMKKKDEEMLKKLRSLTIEHEEVRKAEKKEKLKKIEKAKPKPKLTVEISAPIYKRTLPPLPKLPERTKEWPLPEPKSSARPPEEEAATPPTAELQIPAPPVPAPPKPPAFPVSETSATSQAILAGIDLGKLNLFISDKDVLVIQCDGANTPISITKQGGVEKTNIKLGEEEIKLIVQKFADRAEQPVTKPVFKTTISNLSITAITSSFTGSKFVISKG